MAFVVLGHLALGRALTANLTSWNNHAAILVTERKAAWGNRGGHAWLLPTGMYRFNVVAI